MIDIDLPEVRPMGQTARFYRENDSDYIEIGFTGMKDTVVSKVKPEHMARFKPEWDAHCDGRPLAQRPGTPLTDVEGINSLQAENLIKSNVHNVEELASLSDAQCQGLGHGMITARRNARILMEQRAAESRQHTIDAMGRAARSLQPGAAQSAEIEEVKATVASLSGDMSDMKKMMAQLIELQAKPKRGRPPKAE